MNTRHQLPRIGPARDGYTLAELALALPIMAMLLLGIGSAIKIASKSVPDGTSPSSAALTTSRVLEQLAEEVGFATSITTNITTAGAARQLTFSIPDRDGVAPVSETVTYSWSGVAGAPLLRTFNGTTTTLASNVQEFQLSYDKRSQAVVTTTSATSAETLLISSDGSSSSNDFAVSSSGWCGQYFLPLFASTVTRWNVTKVQFRAMKNGGSNGSTSVQIRSASNQLPTTTILGQATMAESVLGSSYSLRTFSIPNVPLQAPTEGMCLVLQLGSNSPSAFVENWGGGNSINSCLVSTSNAGSTWSTSTADSLRYYIYGTVETQTTDTTYQYLLTNVRCTIRTGNSTSSRMQTSIRVLNEPQVNGP